MSKVNTFVGTYPTCDSKGIYKFIFDSVKGSLDGPYLFYETKDCKCIDYHQGTLISTCSQNEHAGLVMLDVHQPIAYHMDSKMSENLPSSFIYQEGDYVYTANYHEGTLLIYHKEHGKLRIEQRITLGEKAKCHQVFVMDEYLYLICLGMDCIKIYDIENHYSYVKDIILPKGSGPRHAIMDKAHRFLYVLSELSNEVYVYTIGPHHTFRCQQINSVVPSGTKEACYSAAIRISPNGKFLYTSTRGIDIITCFEIDQGFLRQREFVSSNGKHPRDFVIDESGRWMLIMNRDSQTLVVYKLNPDTGEIVELCDEKNVPGGVSIAIQHR